MRWIPILALTLLLAPACERETSEDTASTDTELTPGGGVAGDEDAVVTTTDAPATTATTVEATGAPSPPEGYAIESQPAAEGTLAAIEYVSPRTVDEVSAFYDGQISTDRRVRLDVAGDDVFAYGMGEGSTIGAGSTIQDVERLLDARSEPMIVISPFTMQDDDPLIRDLVDMGQQGQADALKNTRSKVTVVYRVQ
ncbi:MAG TPA: hypothetical protein VJ982_03055 [Gemmatimonadota bacterium]|nr:hypothetical protein [Gemmatimonadota bacterium]